jgi:hypothetical protein
MKSRRAKRKPKRPRGSAPPSVRLPLPVKTEKRHGEGKKYDRRKEKERLRGLTIERLTD